MTKTARRGLQLLLAALALLLLGISVPLAGSGSKRDALPAAPLDTELAKSPGEASAVFAGGCFWGVQAVFEHVRGVKSATSGYAGGSAAAANYSAVSRGDTGHAESVRVVYDPSAISYGTLLNVFFAVAHDPTQLNRQGPDIGSQYRSAIFYADDQQRRIAAAYIAELTRKRSFPAPVVTRLEPLRQFFPAESYHQGYVDRHPDDLYVAINDLPKLRALRSAFPSIYRISASDSPGHTE